MDNIINKEITISDAIKILNSVEIKTLIIINNKKLLGTITDGDIRRGLIKKINLKSSVKKVINFKPYTTTSKIFSPALKNRMLKKKINSLPIVDKKKKFLGQYNLNDIVEENKNNKDKNVVIIMAGGRGKRLSPLTDKIPKPLIRVGKKPIIGHIVDKFLKQGFNKIIITTHYKSNMIKKYFKNKNKYRNLKFYREKKPLGTIGCLANLNLKNYDNCIISNSDILGGYSPEDILKYHILNNSDMTVTTFLKEISSQYGKLSNKGKIIYNIREKPTYFENIAIGLYVVKRKFLLNLKKNKFMDVPDFINKLIKIKKKVMSFPLHEEWIDVGTKDNLKIAIKKIKYLEK